jgi:hypothetical protein
MIGRSHETRFRLRRAWVRRPIGFARTLSSRDQKGLNVLADPFALSIPRQVAVCLLLLLLSIPAALSAQQPPAAPQAPQPAASDQPADQPPPPPLPPPGQKLTSNQLDGLVAPIALYPDPLISQILVASTYPREITLAVQWLNQHPDLSGKALTTAAQEQSWDPSIKALIMFPGVLRRLNQDKAWTRNLGNAFLAQQPDVMQAVQRMRRAAKAAGKLSTGRLMKVIETTDSGETVIEIVPANPNVLFVPVYNPAWIWGPPLWYPYPRWFWGPAPVATGVWFGFGPAIAVGAYIGPAWGGWGGWGWRPGWVSNTVVVNNTFINNTANVSTTNVSTTNSSTTNVNNANTNPTNPSPTNTNPANTNSASTNPTNANTTNANATKANAATANAVKATPVGANTATANTAGAPNGNQTSVWTHDPAHRQGVPYPNNEVAQRFHAPPPRAAQGVQPHPQMAAAHTAGGAGARTPAGRPRAAAAHAAPPRPAGPRR